jgi:selenocysteine lyase/cysteine desulfurase
MTPLAVSRRSFIRTFAGGVLGGSVLGFRLKNYPFDKLQQMLLEKHHIVTRAVPENGLNSNRLSMHCYNTPAEVDRVADIIRTVA